MNMAYQTDFISEELIIENLPLVKQIVAQMNIKTKPEFDREDLISIGVLGLIEAIKRYDYKQKTPFSSYAKWRIRGAIIDELRKNGNVSRDRLNRLKVVNEARSNLQQKFLREPTDKEICDHLSITYKELSEIQVAIHHLSQYSLEEVLFQDGENEFQLIDVIKNTGNQGPEEEILEGEKKERLALAIDNLSGREQIILNLYYKEELTLREIGEILDISLSRVSQIHGKILLKLRQMLESI